jgi:hypothetical protein
VEASVRLSEADDALRRADSSVFPVAQRVLKRVITQDLGLTGLGLNLPHRKSWMLTSSRAQQLLEADELGLPGFQSLPEQVILIARPEEEELEHLTAADLRLRYWRLLFHIRVHRQMDQARATGNLNDVVVRRHIESLGQVAFDEAEDVLRREKFLTLDDSRMAVFIEFAAVYLELLYFSPNWLTAYFPALGHSSVAQRVFSEYVSGDDLLEATHLDGAPDNALPGAGDDATEQEGWWGADSKETPRPRQYHRLAAQAKRSSGRGNTVRSARRWLQAAQCAPALLSGDAMLNARREMQTLTTRLQTALGFDDHEAHDWLEALSALLKAARPGFWNPDARLLYDLQKVAFDHEQEVYVVDTWVWLRSFGRRPLRRKLPYQREVLMCRHLRTAIRRLSASSLVGEQRERLSQLLHHAADAAEAQLRTRLRPHLDQAVTDVRLEPANLPERVARKKVIEEWLDVVAERGFLTLGYLRDVLSRNQLKFPDLTEHDFLTGGPLLMLDRRCAQALDGVYQRGEFYLRWLQRLSSAVFGTRIGRWLTLFFLLPFGGAYVVLEGLEHLRLLVMKVWPSLPNVHLVSMPLLAGVGVFFLGLIHSQLLRKSVLRGWTWLYSLLRGLLYELPSQLLRQPAVRAFLRSMPIVMFRRHLLFPIFVTAVLWPLIPKTSIVEANRGAVLSGLLLLTLIALNSRLGRSVEAATAEWFEWTWYTVRVRIFVALFEGIMDFFKRVMEWIERVLYAVDEWLRFKSGETQATLVVKVVLGFFWAIVAYVVRFCVTLLIEPQINPIKHFPVVTVSHKIILPTQPLLAGLLTPTLGTAWGQTLSGAIIFGTPGVFGFLVWELKENWRLYAANRSPVLQPEAVGSHGETVVRLVRPGFHSGALPKIYSRIRKAHRRYDLQSRRAALARYASQLHHLERAFHAFVERELVELLTEVCDFEPGELQAGPVHLTANSIRWEILWNRHPDSPARFTFAEQSGYLVAGIDEVGWIDRIDRRRRRCCDQALAGFYALSGVDLVREHVDSALHRRFWAYDIAHSGLVVWPDPTFESEVVYPFTDARTLSPKPAKIAELHQLPRLEAEDIFFSRTGIRWNDWVSLWSPETIRDEIPAVAVAIPMVLPRPA